MVAEDLVIEDDGTQHFRGGNGSVNVYSPKYGTMHVTRTREGWTVKYAPGMLPPGFFFDSIAHGFTVADAINRSIGYNPRPDKDLIKFGKRVEGWVP